MQLTPLYMLTLIISFPPAGFEDQGNVLQLLRALYGLRSSPLLWLKDLTATMRQLGFVEVPDDPCLFIHISHPIMAFFYVDDIVLISPENLRNDLYNIRDQLMKAYEIREIGPLHHFLGATIIRDRKDRKPWLSQADYVCWQNHQKISLRACHNHPCAVADGDNPEMGSAGI